MSEQSAQLPLVLFVDDMPDIRKYFEIGVERYRPRFEAVFAEDRESALRVIRDQRPAAVILDVNLSGETGMSIAEDLHEHYPHVLKAVLTAYNLSKTRESADEFGMDVWSKPILMPELIEKVEALLASAPAAGASLFGHAADVVKVIAAAVGLTAGAHVHKVH